MDSIFCIELKLILEEPQEFYVTKVLYLFRARFLFFTKWGDRSSILRGQHCQFVSDLTYLSINQGFPVTNRFSTEPPSIRIR
jgi:hypothetical protein